MSNDLEASINPLLLLFSLFDSPQKEREKERERGKEGHLRIHPNPSCSSCSFLIQVVYHLPILSPTFPNLSSWSNFSKYYCHVQIYQVYVRLIFEECLNNWRNFLFRWLFIYVKVTYLVTTIFKSLSS